MARSIEILRQNLSEHPAVRAWNATEPERVEPASIAVLKPWRKHMKSGVYRLAGVGPGGAAIIAKRCPLHTAAIERLIYGKFLPSLPLPSLAYYGSVEDPDGQSRWLFLEEASGELYSPQNSEHRALAARWLAAIHNAGRHHDWKTCLPDRGLERSLELLRACREKIREHLTNPELGHDGAAVLRTITEQCEVLEAHWAELEDIWQLVPCTLIHGDFVIKNLLVRPSAIGPELLVFDWEYAGWGLPGSDLAQFTGHMASPDLAVYRTCLADWPETGGDSQILRWAQFGKFFRLVDIMYWTSQGLQFGSPDFLLRPISELREYSQRMAQALGEVGWTHKQPSASSSNRMNKSSKRL